MRRKLYAMMNNVCNLFVLGFDLLYSITVRVPYNKVPCQMQCIDLLTERWREQGASLSDGCGRCDLTARHTALSAQSSWCNRPLEHAQHIWRVGRKLLPGSGESTAAKRGR